MGRKTWESIPSQYRPLENRLNIILSSQQGLEGANDENGQVLVFSDFDKALEAISVNPMVNEIFVIGGTSLFELSLGKYVDYCKLVIKTRINKDFEGDVFMPKIDEVNTFAPLYITKTYQHKDITFDYCFLGNRKLLEKKPELIPSRLFQKYPKHQEMQYLEIIKDIITTGNVKDDRTGVGIVGKFGY
jgi:dihydrofolate reductase/thymidylate synthase